MRTKDGRRGLWAGALALVMMMVAAACAPEVPEDEDIEREQVVFDSETGAIPLPSDLALEEDGTLPNLGVDLPASAQADFFAYLDTLHGWLPSTPLTVPVSAPVDEDTLSTDAVMVFRFTQTEEGGLAVDETLEVTDVSFDAEANQIVITTAQPLELGTNYGYVLTQDFTDATITADGKPLVASQPIFFQTSASPLAELNEDGTVATIENDLIAQAVEGGALTEEDVAALEGARQFMQPVVEAALEQGVERSDIIALTRWHTALDPFAVFDPSAGVVPFPNEFIRTGEGGTVNIPITDDADELTTAVLTELNSRDGFSITADGYLPIQSTFPLDPATITKENLPIAWVQPSGTPAVYEDDRYFLNYVEDFDAITFGPTNLPFVQGTTNAGIATGDIKDVQGFSLKPTSAFVFLRSQHPVFADGESLVEQLSDDQAAALEDARQSYQELFLAALVLGYSDRSNIAVAWAFNTDVATEYQQQLNARAEAIVNADGSPSLQANPATAEADPADFSNVGMIQRQAAYETVWFLDEQLRLLDEPTTQPVPVTVTLPSETNCTKPADGYPIVILGHGDTGQGTDAIARYADVLAGECLATVAPDFPLHGLRTPDGFDSGELFLTADAIATKNNFLQAVVDLAVLTEVIKQDGLEIAFDAEAGTDLIDESAIGYAGYSLGSLVGVNFLATDADVNVGALTTPGAKLTSIVLEGTLASILDQLPGGLEPGTFDFFQTIEIFLQWIVEPGDTWTFAPHVQTDPLSPVSYDVDTGEFTVDDGNDLPSNEVLVQMAGQDDTIPNSTTERLATAIGVSLEDTTFPDAPHGFLDDDTEASQCALDQIAAWLATGLTADAELPAPLENACGLGAQ